MLVIKIYIYEKLIIININKYCDNMLFIFMLNNNKLITSLLNKSRK